MLRNNGKRQHDPNTSREQFIERSFSETIQNPAYEPEFRLDKFWQVTDLVEELPCVARLKVLDVMVKIIAEEDQCRNLHHHVKMYDVIADMVQIAADGIQTKKTNRRQR